MTDTKNERREWFIKHVAQMSADRLKRELVDERRLLADARREVARHENNVRGSLDVINEIKRRAYAEGIDLS
jgi:hypothetical protein